MSIEQLICVHSGKVTLFVGRSRKLIPIKRRDILTITSEDDYGYFGELDSQTADPVIAFINKKHIGIDAHDGYATWEVVR